MKRKIAGSILIGLGSFFIVKGAIDANQQTVNAGLGGVFLGIVLLSFSTTHYVKSEAVRLIGQPCVGYLKKLVDSLNLKGKPVYIPPYENLPRGGTFIPLHEDFDLDLAKLDEEIVFLSDIGRERSMGLVISPPLGYDLMKTYEEYSEVDFSGLGLSVAELITPVLQSLGIAKFVTVEGEGILEVTIEGVKVNCSNCDMVQCPICSSIVLSLSKALGKLLIVKDILIDNGRVKLTLEDAGGVNRWI